MNEAPPAGGVKARRRWRVVAGWAAAGIACALVAAGGVTAAALWRLEGNIRSEDISRDLGTDRPTRPARPVASARTPSPLDVLVVGSDSRDGDNGFIGGLADEGRSDTTLLLHLSADRRRAVAVSIPRDSMVDMPSCRSRGGGTEHAGRRQFNEAFTIGGVACTLKTVERLTGLRIDHYIVVDFTGFKRMVDALGTIPVCLPRAVDDRRHHIHLPAGRSRVDGEQALAYVRERYDLGDGSDLGRIDRQQTFISSVLQEATSRGTLTNPPKLYAFLDAATGAVTMDPALARIGALASLAKDIAGIGLWNIRFVTVPTGQYPADPNRLQWTSEADNLWRALRYDTPASFTQSRRPPARTGTATSATGDGGGPSERQTLVEGVRTRTADTDICTM
jgi:LCP family protein required for cell wall assembly